MLWAIFNLSRNPSAQRKLLEEINTVVAPNEEPCGEHIKSMPYLKACLKESMRYSDPPGMWWCVEWRGLEVVSTAATTAATVPTPPEICS